MQTNNLVNNPDKFSNYIAMLADPATSWENEGINISDLDQLINDNMRLILQQTENAETAPKLQKFLIDLSKRMEKFDTPEARGLAFEVTCIAMGIFSEGEKPEWTDLPEDVLQVIFSQNLPKDSSQSGLKASREVSRAWSNNAAIAKQNWVNQGIVSLRTYGCKTAKEAVQCVIDKKLSSANLEDFPDVTDTELTKLIEDCPGINHLILNSLNVIEFPLEKLTNLKILSLFNCYKITGGVLFKGLKNNPQLTRLNLSCCYYIPGDGLAEALKNLEHLTDLNLAYCSPIPTSGMVEALKNLSQLTKLDLSHSQFDDKELAEALQNFSQLTNLNVSCSIWIRDGNMDQILKNLVHLRELNLKGCAQIGRTSVGEWQKKYPNINVSVR